MASTENAAQLLKELAKIPLKWGRLAVNGAAALCLGSARILVLALLRCITAQVLSILFQVGFQAVDTIAAQHGVRLDRLQHNAAVARCSIGGKRVLLAKPMTFMNNSGEAVGRLAKYYKVTPLSTLLESAFCQQSLGPKCCVHCVGCEGQRCHYSRRLCLSFTLLLPSVVA